MKIKINRSKIDQTKKKVDKLRNNYKQNAKIQKGKQETKGRNKQA